MSKTAILEKGQEDRSWEKAIELRERHILPSTQHYYEKPLMLVKGQGQFVWDDKGKKYLDGFAGVVTVSVGHCHPQWVKAIQDQAATLYHTSSLYLHPSLGSTAQKLINKVKAANPELEVCFFTNSGCEANELAAIIAKNYTGRHEFVALRHSFHGRSLMAMTLTGQSPWRHSGPYVFGVAHVPANYTYRRPEGTTPKQYAAWCAQELSETIRYATSGKIAAFIAEPILGNGGVIDPEPEYLPAVYEIVKKAGGLYITDEVQCGVGRTGKKFLGIEHWGVKPDIVTMAKGLGNGYPIGAVITTRAIAESMRGKVHFNTFGGGPVAMAAAGAVLDVLEEERLSDNAFEVGNYLKAKLQKLAEKSPIVGEVRGKGLMLGIELVKDKKTKEPAPELASKIMETCREEGVLIGKGGIAANILRIKPPLIITKKDADTIAAAIEAGLRRRVAEH